MKQSLGSVVYRIGRWAHHIQIACTQFVVQICVGRQYSTLNFYIFLLQAVSAREDLATDTTHKSVLCSTPSVHSEGSEWPQILTTCSRTQMAILVHSVRVARSVGAVMVAELLKKRQHLLDLLMERKSPLKSELLKTSKIRA